MKSEEWGCETGERILWYFLSPILGCHTKKCDVWSNRWKESQFKGRLVSLSLGISFLKTFSTSCLSKSTDKGLLTTPSPFFFPLLLSHHLLSVNDSLNEWGERPKWGRGQESHSNDILPAFQIHMKRWRRDEERTGRFNPGMTLSG